MARKFEVNFTIFGPKFSFASDEGKIPGSCGPNLIDNAQRTAAPTHRRCTAAALSELTTHTPRPPYHNCRIMVYGSSRLRPPCRGPRTIHPPPESATFLIRPIQDSGPSANLLIRLRSGPPRATHRPTSCQTEPREADAHKELAVLLRPFRVRAGARPWRPK